MVAIPSAQRLTYVFDAVGQRNYLTIADRRTVHDQLRRGGANHPRAEPRGRPDDLFVRRGVPAHGQIPGQRHARQLHVRQRQPTHSVGELWHGRQHVHLAVTLPIRYAGNRTRVREVDGSRVTWLYDKTNQLIGENRTGTSPHRNTFTFDSRGNRTVNNQAAPARRQFMMPRTRSSPASPRRVGRRTHSTAMETSRSSAIPTAPA